MIVWNKNWRTFLFLCTQKKTYFSSCKSYRTCQELTAFSLKKGTSKKPTVPTIKPCVLESLIAYSGQVKRGGVCVKRWASCLFWAWACYHLQVQTLILVGGAVGSVLRVTLLDGIITSPSSQSCVSPLCTLLKPALWFGSLGVSQPLCPVAPKLV